MPESRGSPSAHWGRGSAGVQEPVRCAAGFDPQFRPGKILVSGAHAAFTWEIDATGKNGQTASADGIDTLAFDGDGKITWIYGFWNPGPFVAALTA